MFTRRTVSHVVRPSFVLLFSCVTVAAADADAVRVATTARTNAQSGAVTTVDVFTRAGRTNLVRRTKTTAGAVQIRIHQFYRDGSLVGDYVAMPASFGFTTEAGVPYSVSFEFDSAQQPKAAVIANRDGVILDAFTCTNGVFSPVVTTRIDAAIATSKTVREEVERFKKP